jgi:hypothetical protein
MSQTGKWRDRWSAKSRACLSLSLTARVLFTNNSSCHAKESVLQTAVTFYGDCLKMCEDFEQNFGGKRISCCITTTQRLTLPFSPGNFWLKTKWLSSLTHLTFLCFPDWRENLKAAILTQLKWSRQIRRRCWNPRRIRLPGAFKNDRGAGNGA